MVSYVESFLFFSFFVTINLQSCNCVLNFLDDHIDGKLETSIHQIIQTDDCTMEKCYGHSKLYLVNNLVYNV